MPGKQERRKLGHFRICGKCGKRNKSRRLECSRCHEPLRGLPEAAPGYIHAAPPPPYRYRWVVAAVIVAAIAAGLAVHRTFRASTAGNDAAAPGPSDPTPASLAEAPASRPSFDPTSAERYAQAKGSVDRGQQRLARGDFRGAAALLAEAARLVPEDPRIAHAYGRALAGLGSRDRALHQFERAARLDSGIAEYRIDYARGLAAAGRRREAAREYEAAATLEPGNVAAAEGLQRLQPNLPGASETTGVNLGGAPSGGAVAPAGGAFTNEDLQRGARPMNPATPFPTTPSARPLSVVSPSPRPLSLSSPSPALSSPSPRPLSVSSPSPRPSASPYSGPFSSPAPF